MKRWYWVASLFMIAGMMLSGCGSSGGGGSANETPSTYSISGNITSGGNALAGVAVALTGASSATATTDSSGNYSFSGLANGSYTVTPSMSGYTFTPTSTAVTVNSANVTTTQNFAATAATAATYNITGQVTLSGTGIAGVTMSLSGASSASASTDASGNYTFTGLVNGSYTVTPSKTGYTFSPASSTQTLNGANIAGVTFTAMAITASTYSISGTVNGLVGTVVLQDNGADDLSISTNGTFTFATKIAAAATYNVTVKTQPVSQTCIASSNTGTIASANVTNIAVVCSASTANWTGTKQLGVGGAKTFAHGIAVDSSSNVYMAGFTNGGLDGNTLTGTGANNGDLFLTKYDSSGNKVRTKQLGVAGADTEAQGVAVDSSGNVYVAGFTMGGLDGNTLSAAGWDYFLTKYDSSGNKVRTKQHGEARFPTLATGVAVDSSGNVYVASYNMSTSHITMYDSSGNEVRTNQLDSAIALSVAVDSSANVYVAGYTTGGLDGNTLTGTADSFITKYDSSGNKVRTKQLGVAGKDTEAQDVAVDSSGNVYVCRRRSERGRF